MNEIKEKIGQHLMYIIVDQATVTRSLYIANLPLGVRSRNLII